ncbi:UDP-glucose flavonoid 3-O-glucosyltransferase 7-like [Malania oleifera]|uniref:UDP-glucose flavonoid 3-O-glucosyltransferase 7-like n=1 Tax=Malania oleifera TaxID=397392 RepID=UPI0025ADD7D2|nr:UDP-glucose flavonoid 3-O-glucosyltransferase 7-like [Malania oleifera]
MDSQCSPPLHIAFLPFLAPGHMVPLTEMARLVAARGPRVTIITTPSNALLLRPAVDKVAAAGHHIRLRLLPFPSKEVGLPDGLENFVAVLDQDTATKLYRGVGLLRPHIEALLTELRPDCIVSDNFYSWTAEFASRVRTPRLAFQGTCIFAAALEDAILRHSPHRKVGSDSDPFVVPGLPDPITMTRPQLPDFIQKTTQFTKTVEEWREAESKSFGVLINAFYEMEPAYAEHYRKVMGKRVYHIGPTVLMHGDAGDKAHRIHETVVGENELLTWLDSKQPESVVYVSFGSGCRFPDEQLAEIAGGLDSAGHPFIWVVVRDDKEIEEDEEETKWLPEGFEEKMKKEGKGVIVRGWAPQVLILGHPAIGCFVTHCGWNSVVEGISAGVPMVTWPLYSEQFYNERLVIQMLRIGVEVGSMEWALWVHVGRKLIERQRIEAAVRRVMDGGDEARELRRRAASLAEVAKMAVREGGSSYKNLTALIEDLQQNRAAAVADATDTDVAAVATAPPEVAAAAVAAASPPAAPAVAAEAKVDKGMNPEPSCN